MRPSQRAQCVEVGRVPGVVHGQDRAGAGRDRCGDLERGVSTTSWISCSAIVGGEKGRKSVRLGGAEPAVMVQLPGPGARCRKWKCGSPATALQTQVTCADAPLR